MPTRRKYDNQAQRQAAYRARQAAAHNEQLSWAGLPPLSAVPTIPGHRRWQVMTKGAIAMLQSVHAEMQDYYEERSEAWRDSERGEAFLDRMDGLQEIIDSLESLA